jgi:predicted AlkP superfamily phosphohydrolase/phosphomutase
MPKRWVEIMTKILVIGLDGCCWNLLNPWIESGLLPTFQKLKSKGVFGKLKSTYPFLTCPAWKCYSTGKNPGKLGVFNWFDFNKITKRITINNSLSFDGKEIWDILSLNNYVNGIINMPLTYPPKTVLGFIVSGVHAFEWDQYTYPTDLKKYLDKNYNYKITPDPLYQDLSKMIPLAKNIIEKRFRVCFDLNSKYKCDFINLTIFVIDGLNHFHYDFERSSDKELLKVWKLIDNKIQESINMINPEIIIFISDHGITPIKAHFKANEWLEKERYLFWQNKLEESKYNKIQKYVKINRILISKIYSFTPRIFKRIISGKYILKKIIGNEIIDENQNFGITKNIQNIDWKKTKALVLGDGLLYIMYNNISKKEISKLITKLSKIKNPTNNEDIFKLIPKEEIYFGKYFENAPDYYLAPKEGYYVSDYISYKKNIFETDNIRWKSYHSIDGFFLAYGKDIKKNYKLEGAKIYDITPTILHIFGVPIPNDMDGRVLSEIFEADSEYSRKKTVYVDPDYYERKGNKEETKTRIRKLRKNANI